MTEKSRIFDYSRKIQTDTLPFMTELSIYRVVVQARKNSAGTYTYVITRTDDHTWEESTESYTVDQELLARNEYLAAENRILKSQLNGRLRLSDVERATLGEIGHRLGRKVLGEVANVPRRTPSWPGTASWSPVNSMARRPDEALTGLGSSERSSN